ncbi:toxin [Methylobacter sp. BlB1]|uniref:Tc toxin subunit A-related protein n=1 Tax=unclassified Methylobacter TaxID=2635283 RepID=UPI001895E1D9|nr:toxin [Methylobacter sp. BlB1]MBF6650644.1 toxin [Methylobacter sp. BlB1]
MSIEKIKDFHKIKDMSHWIENFTQRQDTQFTYTFENFFHPFVGELIEKLNKESLPGLLDPNFHQELTDKTFFKSHYTPQTSGTVKLKFPIKEIDVSVSGPYANYNWELLFHIPLTIAVHLSKNQRFAEAQRWFHFIFDPTCNDTSIPPLQRYWKFIAFRKPGCFMQIDQLLTLLSKPDAECNDDERRCKGDIESGFKAIMNDPFKPHKVARTRPVAYQYCVVMKYIDNLIAWGDQLFRQDTIESLNEATQRYVLAANILGARPEQIPQQGRVRPKTFAELKKRDLDSIGNTFVELQGNLTLNFGLPQKQGADPSATGSLFGIGRTLYFCIPRNDKLLGYWDTVADRLFKIRNCMNIEGVVRQLALFDPPLDPGMLVKAAAAGIDIGSIVNGMNQPISPVRSLFLIQKALELCSEVRGLGSALLSAIEKGDGERLALLRQSHEINIQQLQQEVRFLQWKSAQESTTSLLTSRATALERLHYYQRLLGAPADPNAPDTLILIHPELNEENFDEIYGKLVGQYDKPIATQAFPQLNLTDEGRARLHLTTNEDNEFVHLKRARDTSLLSSSAHALAASFVSIPDAKANLHFWGLGATMDVKVGTALSSISRFAGNVLGIISAWEREQAGMAAKTASYERRADEWLLQYNLAAHELMQIGRQILSSLIAEQIAHREYLNIKKQIENSQEVDRFLRDKFTNAELYGWMQGEISRLFYEYYRFTFDTARKAEQTMKRELMRPEVDATDYIKFNYWDSGRKGVLSGEALYLDIKRLEMAYHENNKREFELTKHVSLRQLNPLALLALKATGICEVNVPEWLFDLDGPGHYIRRIKNVSLSIPSVTGPYTSVSCTLSLLKSSLRKSPLLKDDEYARQGSEDDRFIDYFGTVQSIVTSSGNNDSGMFETNLREERLLPFEGAGAESTWKLELPSDFRQFDYNTITDVILHFRYTARQGGGQMRDKALEHLKEIIGEANSSGLALGFYLRQDFPSEWHRFVNGSESFETIVKHDHFPYFTQGKDITIDALQLHAVKANNIESKTLSDLNVTDTLKEKGEFELSLPSDATLLKRDKDAIVFLLIRYSLS